MKYRNELEKAMIGMWGNDLSRLVIPKPEDISRIVHSGDIGSKLLTMSKQVVGINGFFTGFVDEVKPETLKRASQFPFCFKLDGVEYIDIPMQVTPMDGKSYVEFMITYIQT